MHINILYATDKSYLPHFCASVCSLFENNKEVENIDVYVITNDLDVEDIKKCNDLSQKYENRKIIVCPFEEIENNISLADRGTYPKIGYARLLSHLVCDCDKILYLDCDTIVTGSLKELWNTDIDEYYVAGVLDNPALYSREAVGLKKEDAYINAGVLLINSKKWREDNILPKFQRMIDEKDGFVLHHDQGIINGVCKDKISVLHPRYNLMPQFIDFSGKKIKKLYDMDKFYHQNELDEGKENPVIIHYIQKFYNRPWSCDCSHPMRDEYIKYAKMSPYGYKKDGKELSYGVKTRRFIYRNMPFFVYFTFEKILDLKRKNTLKKYIK